MVHVVAAQTALSAHSEAMDIGDTLFRSGVVSDIRLTIVVQVTNHTGPRLIVKSDQVDEYPKCDGEGQERQQVLALQLKLRSFC